ncbi:glutathione S-transferase family protein [Emcibacter sp.]|uniref:glutathione S-transferase family protein n=1 Tax=Emcibacter sp. TaxID=1979954 RepID=UPI003A90C038
MPIRECNDAEVLNLKGLHLFHTNVSNCSTRVRLLLEEKGLSWTSHHLNLVKRENLTESYFRIHPNGLVPALVDDGVPVTDSIDILYYLEEKYPQPAFLPQDSNSREEIRRWIDLAGEIHVKGVKTFVYGKAGLVTKDRSEMDRYEKLAPGRELVEFHWKSIEGFPAEDIEAAVAILQDSFERVEAQLEGRTYLVGDSYSLADITWVVQYVLLTGKGYDFTPYPNIRRWVAHLEERRAFNRAVTDWLPGGGRAPTP